MVTHIRDQERDTRHKLARPLDNRRAAVGEHALCQHSPSHAASAPRSRRRGSETTPSRRLGRRAATSIGGPGRRRISLNARPHTNRSSRRSTARRIPTSSRGSWTSAEPSSDSGTHAAHARTRRNRIRRQPSWTSASSERPVRHRGAGRSRRAPGRLDASDVDQDERRVALRSGRRDRVRAVRGTVQGHRAGVLPRGRRVTSKSTSAAPLRDLVREPQRRLRLDRSVGRDRRQRLRDVKVMVVTGAHEKVTTPGPPSASSPSHVIPLLRDGAVVR
jgi:hypothetical protein